MKQRIDMNRLKADILSIKQSKKVIEAVTNNALFVIEDVCTKDARSTQRNFKYEALYTLLDFEFSLHGKMHLGIPTLRFDIDASDL